MNARTGFSAASLIVLAFMCVSVVAQEVKPLAPFTSVELQGGGKVIVSHGATQRVTVLKGSRDFTKVRMANGGRLVVENCQMRCPRGYQMEIEIVVSGLAGISVANGGLIQSRGHFPPQAAIGVAVTSGGTIDIRSMSINSVTASVSEGGRIFVKPQTAMVASVFEGGAITYWGDAQVTSSIQRGGVVTKGNADEADKPVSDLGDSVIVPPPVPRWPQFNRYEIPGDNTRRRFENDRQHLPGLTLCAAHGAQEPGLQPDCGSDVGAGDWRQRRDVLAHRSRAFAKAARY